MERTLFVPQNKNEFLIAFDSLEEPLKGRIYHCTCPEGLPFSNFFALTLKVEDILDLNEDRPSAFVVVPMSANPKPGAVATFELSVLFRQHDSWQGKFVWVERGTEFVFRSYLDLVLSVYSALVLEYDERQIEAAQLEGEAPVE